MARGDHLGVGPPPSLTGPHLSHHHEVEPTPQDDQAYGVAADELRQFIDQFEQLEAKKQDIAERQKQVMAKAKARGYDTMVMKQIIALRRRDKEDIAEEESILDMYKAALGMA